MPSACPAALCLRLCICVSVYWSIDCPDRAGPDWLKAGRTDELVGANGVDLQIGGWLAERVDGCTDGGVAG